MSNPQNKIMSRRDRYYRKIPSYYHPASHLLITFCVLCACIAVCLDKARPFAWSDLPFVWLFIIISSAFVYFHHRFAFHRRVPWLKNYYAQHIHCHHDFFDYEHMHVRSIYEVCMIHFWPIAIYTFLVIPPLAYLFTGLFEERIGWLFAAIAFLYFIFHEIVHLAAHTYTLFPWYKIPVISFLTRYHHVHHTTSKMSKKNFSVLFPFWDVVLGTMEWPPEHQQSRSELKQESFN